MSVTFCAVLGSAITAALQGEPISVRHAQGSAHGFLVVETIEGVRIATSAIGGDDELGFGPCMVPATGFKASCRLWLGSVTDQGYGRFKAGNQTYLISRYAWGEKGKPDPGAHTVSARYHRFDSLFRNFAHLLRADHRVALQPSS